MRRVTWNDLLVGLTLVHLGQQLGSDGRLSRACFEIVSALIPFFARIS